MNNFQTILIAIFLAFFVLAVLMFSGTIKIGGSTKTNELNGSVTIWGTFPSSRMSNVFANALKENKELKINYSAKDPSTYQQDLIEAFASGKGPDIFMITPDMIKKNSNFIYKLPYTSYREKTFRDLFINGADIYLDGDGIVGFPILVDPMVLYYNKDILTNEAIVYPPQSWETLFSLNSSLTKRNDSGLVSQSMIALGQYDNINNVKDILALLLIQNDNQIVVRGPDRRGYMSVLSANPSNYEVSPAEAVIKFFVEFSNVSDTAYSWNRSLPNSYDMFTSGKLAFYIGKASELFKIQAANPNLSFDVVQIPQVKDYKVKKTFGDIYAFAISNKSGKTGLASQVMGLVSQGEDAKNLSIALSLPPASKVLLSEKPTDPYLFTFFNSALISRSWLDPDKGQTNEIFKELIENKLSNNLSTGEAINKAQAELEMLVNKQ